MLHLEKDYEENWEVLDMNERDKVDEDLDLEGDEGLRNIWGIYFKTPSNEYVRSFVMSLEDVQQWGINPEAKKHNVSPRRASLCDKATANVQKQKKAESVTNTALRL
jgi:hypothetical protein